MKETIIIDKVILKKGHTASRLSAIIIIDGIQKEMFFEVDQTYGKYFCETRADCFVVALLPQAAMDGQDIVSRIPVSERLLFQLNFFLCVVLARVYQKKKIKVSAPADDRIIENSGAVGTGLTCGVDSLYTVASYTKTAYRNHNLTHLCLLNVGSHHIGRIDPEEMGRFRLDHTKRFCDNNSFAFVHINSNVHDFSPNYTRYFTLLNAAAVMSLLRLFSLYYHSSGVSIENFHVTAVDLAHFEVFVLKMVSMGNLKFFSAGTEVSRLEKVRILTTYPESYYYLNVCNLYPENCGKCIKCLRTLYALDIFNALDKYSKVFDLTDYQKNHDRYMGECFARAFFARDQFCREIWPLLKKKYRVSMWARISEVIRFIRSRFKIYSLSHILYRLRD